MTAVVAALPASIKSSSRLSARMGNKEEKKRSTSYRTENIPLSRQDGQHERLTGYHPAVGPGEGKEGQKKVEWAYEEVVGLIGGGMGGGV